MSVTGAWLPLRALAVISAFNNTSVDLHFRSDSDGGADLLLCFGVEKRL